MVGSDASDVEPARAGWVQGRIQNSSTTRSSGKILGQDSAAVGAIVIPRCHLFDSRQPERLTSEISSLFFLPAKEYT
jgi:hypothetical protein